MLQEIKLKPPRPVRVVNYETDHKSDYEETSSDSDKYVYNIKTQNQRIKKPPRVQAHNNIPTDSLIDTSALINIIDLKHTKE